MARLPFEILDQIFSVLADESAVFLLPICQTCRLFKDIAQPLLSRNVSLHRYRDETRSPEVVRHFLRRPVMRAQVRTLRLDDKFIRREDLHQVSEDLSELETEQLAQCADQAFPQMEMPVEWKDHLAEGRHDAVSALMVAWSKRLESVYWVPVYPYPNAYDIETNPEKEEPMLHWLARQVVTKLSCFKPPKGLPLYHLRVFELSGGEFSVNPRFAIPFFHLPNLRVFRAYHVNEYDPEATSQYSITFPQRSSGVQELFLDRWGGYPEHLAEVIGSCKNLRKLYLVKTTQGYDEDWWTLNSVTEPIFAHRETLEELVCAGMEKYTVADEFPETQRLGLRLRSFTNLRKLEVDIDTFEEGPGKVDLSDCLPSSLERLCINGVTAVELETVMYECREGGRFPNMICITYGVCEAVPDSQRIQKLKELSKHAGVELQVIGPSLSGSSLWHEGPVVLSSS